ncbi:MAG TPA: DUF3617 family protein [Bradyrhizobium sp.]|nr:DUF3617 family protein [Bradyrhizobium sp.]
MIEDRSAIVRLCRLARPTACGLVVACALGGSTGLADGIEPGLWHVTSRTQTGGVIGPPHESSKCLTAQDVADLATTFSPVSRTVNSTCGPIERSLSGSRLTWRLTCRGQLDMELTGEFNFDSPRHYTAIVQSKAAMAGMPMVDSQENIEARWLSACPQ